MAHDVSSDEHVTVEDLATARDRVRSSVRGVVPVSLLVQGSVQVTAAWLITRSNTNLDGFGLGVAIAALSVGILIPGTLLISVLASRKTIRQLAQSMAKERRLQWEGRRREFETRLANALEMADGEAQVISTVGRALRDIVGDGRVELLLADNSHAHLNRQLVSGPSPAGTGCRVETPDRCVAARRGQTQVFPDSENLDACPYLEHREGGRCSAVCVPVSIMGRTVGVLHHADPFPAALDNAKTQQLEVLANQLGARLGMLRVMSDSQLQASTDPVTGLANRRDFENRLRRLQAAHVPFTVVLGDLDHFKLLNDTFGHEAGDRALRVYARVLKDGLRPDDLACRYGGEEFVFALANSSAAEAVAVCERLRESLALAINQGGAANFTASYGIAPWHEGSTMEELVAEADTALYQAKRDGRNRNVVYHSASPSATENVTSGP